MAGFPLSLVLVGGERERPPNLDPIQATLSALFPSSWQIDPELIGPGSMRARVVSLNIQ